MKFLRCKYCRGEVDLIGPEKTINRKIRCTKCGYTNEQEAVEQKGPEVVIIRRKS